MRLQHFRHAVAVVGVALIAGAADARLAAAQVKLELTPYFASYFPASKTRDVATNDWEKQANGPGAGVRLEFRMTQMLSIEASGTYVWSGIIPNSPGSAEEPFSGTVTLASGRINFQPRRTNIFFLAGAGIVRRAGEAWSEDIVGLDELTDVAAVVGFGVRARVSPTYGFKLGVEVNLYESNMDGNLAYYSPRQQKDFVVSIGIPIGLVGR